MTDLAYLSARLVAARIRAGELTAAEVLEAYLDRIATRNPALTAVVSLDADRARAAALVADQALARGEPTGPLHGVPVTLKDGHEVAGLRTTIGTPVFDHVAPRDGTVAARLRAAGAVIVGHTNVPPFLAGYTCENPIFGRSANPWDPALTPGGSSGGAAAALAAGLTPVEVGSDLAGSVRLPAHFCGVYGLKATENRVPATGFFQHPGGGPRSVRVLGSFGPMARDLDDLDLVLRLISGPDRQDGDVPPVPLGTREARPVRGLRLAVRTELPGTEVVAGVAAAVERVADGAAAAGARVDRRLPDVDWSVQQLFADLVGVVSGAFDPGAQLPAEHRDIAWYLAALDRRDGFIGDWERFFDGYDALLLPSGADTAAGPIEGMAGAIRHGTMLVFANLAGLPVLTVPAGHDEHGLPVGVQLVGPRWSESRLLDIAAALEGAAILPGFSRPPGY